MIDAITVRELFDYDAATGVFTRRVTTNNNGARQGAVITTANGPGRHLITRFAGKKYYLHRLAWLYVYGRWPDHVIDHINGDPTDNRIDNLRDVLQFVNQQNQRSAHADNRHGLMGVAKNHKRFSAQLQAEGKYHYIGTYDTPEQAHAAYIEARRELHKGNTL